MTSSAKKKKKMTLKEEEKKKKRRRRKKKKKKREIDGDFINANHGCCGVCTAHENSPNLKIVGLGAGEKINK